MKKIFLWTALALVFPLAVHAQELRFAVSFDRVASYQGVSNWHPLTWLSYGLDVTPFGVDPGAKHAVNLGFHILNLLLVFALFDRATRAPLASAFVAVLSTWITRPGSLVNGLIACTGAW